MRRSTAPVQRLPLPSASWFGLVIGDPLVAAPLPIRCKLTPLSIDHSTGLDVPYTFREPRKVRLRCQIFFQIE